MSISLIHIIEILGTFSFAVSGAFAAMEKKLDLLGVLILAFVTSIGGGTLRDLLIGETPVFWMREPSIGWIIAAGATGTLFFGRHLKKINPLLNIFDALGLGLFTLIGIQKGLSHGLDSGVCIALGTITGCFGGVLRDVFINRVPLIFQKEIYATASIIGGSVYLLLTGLHIDEAFSAIVCIALIFVIRMLGIRYKWHLRVTGKVS